MREGRLTARLFACIDPFGRLNSERVKCAYRKLAGRPRDVYAGNITKRVLRISRYPFSLKFFFFHSNLRQAVQGGAFPKRRHRLCRREYPYPPHRQNSLPLCPRQCRKFLRFQQRSDNTVYCFSITRIFAFCAKAIVFRVPLVFALTKAITTLFSNPFI